VSRPPEPLPTDPFGDIPDPVAQDDVPAPPLRAPRLAPSPERAVVQRRRLAALLASIGWIGGHLAVFGVRGDLGQLPFLYVVAEIALPFVVAVASLAIALRPGKLGLGVRAGLISALGLLGPASFVLIAAGAPVPVEVPAGSASLLGILVCFDITVGWAAVPLLLAALTLRGAFPAAARWRSALVGAGAGLFAGATMNLHCPNIAPLHMLFGHGLPVVVATVLGAVLLSLRARP